MEWHKDTHTHMQANRYADVQAYMQMQRQMRVGASKQMISPKQAPINKFGVFRAGLGKQPPQGATELGSRLSSDLQRSAGG